MITYSERVAAALRAEMAGRIPRLTGVQLADALGCSQQSASDRMVGRVPLSLDELATVCDWLGVDQAEFLAKAAGVAA